MEARAQQSTCVLAALRLPACRAPAAAPARALGGAAGAARRSVVALGARRCALQPLSERTRRAASRVAPCRCDAAPAADVVKLLTANLRRGGGVAQPKRKPPAADAPPKPPRDRSAAPPDPRTVEFLVERGVGSLAAVTSLLSRNERGATRGSHANAEAAWDWLHDVLAECAAEEAAEKETAAARAGSAKKKKSGPVSDAAASAASVEELPALPPRPGRPRKGEGEPFTAASAVRAAPELLYCGIERLRRGWAFLRAPTALGGAGLDREAAQVALFRFGRWVLYTPASITARAAFLTAEFGAPDGMRTALHVSALLHFSEETLRSKAATLRSAGLDATKLLSSAPRLASISAAALREKAAWLRDVAGTTPEQINAAPALLAYSLRGRVRPRYFFAARLKALDGRALMTFCYPSDADFLENTLRNTAAATWSVEQYRSHIASKEFTQWADAQEAELRRRNAAKAKKA
jgi:hypothetical protein